MASSIGYINAFSYSSAFFNGGSAGKLYVPVNRASLIYSNFDHVSGTVAKSGQNGVSISKIRILNSLIERFSAIKNESKKSAQNISDNQAEILIKNYQEQINRAMKNPYVLNGARPMTGELFQIQA